MKLTVAAALALLVAGASYADMAAAWDYHLMDALNKWDTNGAKVDVWAQCKGKLPTQVFKGKAKCSGKGFGGHDDVPWTYQVKLDKHDNTKAKETFKVSLCEGSSFQSFQSTDTRASQVHGEDTWTDGQGQQNTDRFSGHLKCKAGKFGGKIKDSQKYTTGKKKITLTCSGTMEAGASCSWQ